MDVNMNLYSHSTCTRLQLAARNLDHEWNSEEEEVMRVLLAHGADVNSATKSGISPLHLAVVKNSLKMVTLLLDHRADANLVDWKGKLPLHYAVMYPSCEMVACLLEHGANPNLWVGRSPLQDAIHGHKTCNGPRRQRREFIKIIRLLVKAGALVEMLGEQDRDSVKTILERHSLPTPALVPDEPTETNTISLP
jgi:ankyrin repeat protein